jgi:hypothetical protein
MKIESANRLLSVAAIRRRLLGWAHNEQGTSAIEFAFIAPVLLIWLFGVFEAGRAYSQHRRFTNATSMVGDLITQRDSVTQAQIDGIYSIVRTAMGGHASDFNTFNLRIIPLAPASNDPNTALIYAATKDRAGATTYYRGQTYTDLDANEKEIVKGKAGTQGGIIRVMGEYRYKPVFNFGTSFTSVTWRTHALYNPRNGGCLVINLQNCVLAK